MKQETVRIQEQSKITINDIADALGISKTTVSRAISGKGRVGPETRQKVLDYIAERHYKPNFAAQTLSQKKTYNIGWVIPGDQGLRDLPFYQQCLMGISETASARNYDVMISLVYEDDISQLQRMVENKKVDGIILGRTLVEDKPMAYLAAGDIPFVTIGSSPDENVIQIDNDHESACSELVSILIMKGIRRIALIGGKQNHVVNQSRLKGFRLGFEKQGLPVQEDLIYMDADTKTQVERSVDEILKKDVECILCMDDRICYETLLKLRKCEILVPAQMKVAAFYNGTNLEHDHPSVTAVHYDPKELGTAACEVLLDYMDGKEVLKRRLLDYEVLLKGSTL